MPATSNTPSTSQPALDWNQVQETINMLTLAVAQIECTMSDGEKSVAELTQSFTFIASQLQTLIEQQGDKKTDDPKTVEPAISAQDIHQQVVSAIIAFQFYDRLSQRLQHVKRDLSWLSELVSNRQELNNPDSWKKLQEDIMSNYTMEEERIMFQHIISGASVEEALAVYQHHFSKKKEENDTTSDEVDLF